MDNKPLLQSILDDALKIIRNPVGFYRDMAKTGGFADPLIFVVVMAAVTGLLVAILSLLHLGMAGAAGVGIGAVIIFPLMAIIGSFIAAGILFVIWKLMGSNESFETAYRCVAYAAAIYPVTALLGIIPYVGSVIGVVWGMYLMIVASIEVHQIRSQTAWTVFAVLGVILVITNISSEMASRRMATHLDEMGVNMEELEQMSPEEAAKAVGEFLKGFENATREQQQAE
ncbi:MAG: YIP1 family protein [Thiogranum sp.]|nr:YIP1 family protein [Thiogranum sp.]